MAFTFLQEEIESILLFATAPAYLAILIILQSRNLKLLEKLKQKGTSDLEKIDSIRRLKKLKFLTPALMLLGFLLHLILYLSICSQEIRPDYFISISIMYVVYVIVAWINFYLKGAGILKDVGDYNGLPGY